MSPTMKSPNENTTAAAIANNQTDQADPHNASAMADAQDKPLTSGGSKNDTKRDIESSLSLEHEVEGHETSDVRNILHF